MITLRKLLTPRRLTLYVQRNNELSAFVTDAVTADLRRRGVRYRIRKI